MKLPSAWKVALVFFTGTLAVGTFPVIVQAQGSDFYIYQEGNVQPVRNGDPQQIKPEYWTVWIFSDRGGPNAPRGNKCAATDGNSAAAAAQAAKRYLDINIAIANFFRSPLTECSGQKTLGPIAVMGTVALWNPPSVPAQLKDVYEELKSARETWMTAKEVMDTLTGQGEKDSRDHVASALGEYGKRLEDATGLVNQLTEGLRRPMGDLISRLNDAMDRVRNTGRLVAQEMPGLGQKHEVAQEQTSGGSCPGGEWSEKRQKCVCPTFYFWSEQTKRCTNGADVEVH